MSESRGGHPVMNVLLELGHIDWYAWPAVIFLYVLTETIIGLAHDWARVLKFVLDHRR